MLTEQFRFTTMFIQREQQARWPAIGTAIVFLGYATGKAAYAAQDKMGFPGGPHVSAVEHERYAREIMDVSVAQWMACATGVLGALLMVATVTQAGRKVPRVLMLLLLLVAFVGFGCGAAVVAVDGFFDIGIGWSAWYGGVGVVALVLFIATTYSYLRATRRPSPNRSAV